jgi:hypothetical protein
MINRDCSVSPPQPTESFLDKEQRAQTVMLEKATIHAISWSRKLEKGRNVLKEKKVQYFDTLSRLRVIQKQLKIYFKQINCQTYFNMMASIPILPPRAANVQAKSFPMATKPCPAKASVVPTNDSK